MLKKTSPIIIKSDTKKYSRHSMPARIPVANKYSNTRSPVGWVSSTMDDILGIEGLQLSVVTAAATISHLVKGVTIGPNSVKKVDSSSEDELLSNSTKSLGENTLNKRDNHSRNRKSDTIFSDCESVSEEKSRILMKLMVELDKQRQEEVRQSINARTANYEKQARKHQEDIKCRQAALKLEAEARAQLEKQKLLCQRREIELREMHQQEQLKHELEQRVRERNHLIQKAEQRQEEEKRKREEKNKLISAISHCQTGFVTKYQEILESLKSCKGKKELNDTCSGHVEMVKSLTLSMEQLVRQCKCGDLSTGDVQKASGMLLQIGNYSDIIREEVIKINTAIEKNTLASTVEQNESSTSVVKVEQVPAPVPAPVSAPAPVPVPPISVPETQTPAPVKSENSETLRDNGDTDAMQTYHSHLQFLENFEKSYTDLLKDDSNKDFSFKCRKAVNIPVNSISDTSAAHLMDKVQKLTYLLAGQSVESGNVCVSASSHPQGIAFCTSLLAKKFVVQGETVVSSKKEAAFPIAAVIIQIWSQFPIFGTLLLAHFYKSCPYLVPVALPQMENQSDEQYYLSLGYELDSDGKVEKQATYLKRMSGMMRLYAAILVTKPKGQNVPHPHGIKHAWCWLSRTLNMGPQPDLTATLLLDFLDITGSTMSTVYGRQFQKILHFICTVYFPMLDKMRSSGGPVTRLEVFLEKRWKEGRFHRPSGMLPSNFW